MEFSTINRTIRHVVQVICRLWSWHSVPVSKRRGPSSLSLQETSVRFRHNLPSLKHQQRSDRMVSLRDYEICLLFLLLVKFHGSGKCEVILPYKGFDNIFLPCAILSLDIENADPLFLNVIFVKWFRNSKVAFNSFCISKFRYVVGISIVW